MHNSLRILTASVALALAVTILPATAHPAKALACNAGWTKTQVTKYFTIRTHINANNTSYSGTYKMLAIGCYSGSDTECFTAPTVTWYSGRHVDPNMGGPSCYHMSDGTNRTDFWNDRGPWNPSGMGYSFTYAYLRIKLTPGGSWTTTGTTATCSFGLAGGTCSVGISSTP